MNRTVDRIASSKIEIIFSFSASDRHAKKVSEQNAREKVLAAEKQSVATLSVSPLVSTASIIRTASPIQTMKINSEGAPAKPARRVLPEHEGRYKIKLPSGTTERSKQILAKKISRECIELNQLKRMKLKLKRFSCSDGHGHTRDKEKGNLRSSRARKKSDRTDFSNDNRSVGETNLVIDILTPRR